MANTWNELGIDVKNRTSGSIKVKCPQCSHTRRKKSDPCLYVNLDDKVYKCFNCEFKGGLDNNTEMTKKEEKVYIKPEFNNRTALPDGVIQWFMKRAIKQETVNHFKVAHGLEVMPQAFGYFKNLQPELSDKELWGKAKVNTVQYPYYRNGEVINIKYKTPNKWFKMSKDAEKTLYNVDAIKDSEEMLICEGEEEVWSWHQAGYKYAVSVPNGASKDTNNLEYLEPIWEDFLKNKKKVYIATDNDQPGEKLAEDLVSRFGKDICHIIEYPKIKYSEKDSEGNVIEKETKDANDILKWESPEFLIKLKEKAKSFPIEGVYGVEDVESEMWDRFNNKDHYPKGTTTYIKSLDPHFTWRRGEMTVVYGPGSQGKSSLTNNMTALKSANEGDVWGVFSPEQFPMEDYFDDIIHMYIGKSTDPNFPTFQMSKAEYKKGMDFCKKHFKFIYPPENHDIDTLINTCKQAIIRHGLTGIILDPFNQLDRTGVEAKMRDDQYISYFGSKWKRFISNHDLYNLIITHGDAEYDQKTMVMNKLNMYRHIEGGKKWSRKADNIIAYSRPNFMIDIKDSLCKVDIQKIKKHKLTGSPGNIELTFDKKTNRFYDIEGRCAWTNVILKSKQMIIPMEEQVSNIGDPIADDFFGTSDDKDDLPWN